MPLMKKKPIDPLNSLNASVVTARANGQVSPSGWNCFQKAFIQALFGFVDRETGLRRYREAFFLVGRKNGKSTLLAGLALYMLIADGEGGAEVYSTATKYAQAHLLFDECHNMVKQSPDLSRHMKKRKSDLYYVPGMGEAAAAVPEFGQSGRPECVVRHHGRTARRKGQESV